MAELLHRARLHPPKVVTADTELLLQGLGYLAPVEAETPQHDTPRAGRERRFEHRVHRRAPLVHQAEGFRERGIALSVSYNPTPSTPLGFMALVAPSWGSEARSGAEALWGRETMGGLAHGGVAQGNRVDGQVGYGLPVGSRLIGTPRVGFSTSEYGRDYRVGYGLGVLDRGSLNFELGVDAQRQESPLLDGASNGVLGRASLRW